MFSQEIERLNMVLRTTSEELEEYRRKDSKYLAEI